MRLWTATTIVAALWLLTQCADALQISAAVEQAIGDGPFVPAGNLKGVIEPQAFLSTSTITFERHGLTNAEQQQLQAAANDAGFVKLRVGQKLVTSVPARCLVAAGDNEQLTGAVTPSGELVALAYDLSQMRCEPLAAPETSAQGRTLAKRVPLVLTMPVAVPAIQKEPRLPADGQRGAQRASGTPAAKQAGPSAKEGAAGGSGAEKEAPPPDNRTWLQKNWIYFLPVAFMLLNGVAGGNRDQQRGQAPAAGQRQRQGTR